MWFVWAQTSDHFKTHNKNISLIWSDDLTHSASSGGKTKEWFQHRYVCSRASTWFQNYSWLWITQKWQLKNAILYHKLLPFLWRERVIFFHPNVQRHKQIRALCCNVNWENGKKSSTSSSCPLTPVKTQLMDLSFFMNFRLGKRAFISWCANTLWLEQMHRVGNPLFRQFDV